jgi:uncharacterized protein
VAVEVVRTSSSRLEGCPMQRSTRLLALTCALSLIPAAAIAAPPERGGPPSGTPHSSPVFAPDEGGEDTEEEAGATPVDYTEIAGLTQPRFDSDEILFEQTTYTMRDGVEIYLEITRPDTDEELPVILEASPYHGTLSDRDGIRIFPDARDDEGDHIGMTGYFAPRGYAVVMMGLRGTGRSQGCLDHMGENDKKDLVEVIERLADEEWSNGRIGMTGHSYVGSTPKFAAAGNPDGLATIVPSAGIARAYDHQFQHGVAYAGQWAGLPAIYNLLAMERHLPSRVLGQYDGDNFGNDMEYFGCGWTTTSFQDGHRQLTGEYSAFHAERDHSEGATAWDGPVFLVQGLYDNAVRPNAMDWFTDRDNPEDKLWYGQFDHGSAVGGFEGHPNRRFDQWQFALHAWFDKHLAGNDVDTGPAVELFMNNEPSRSAAIPEHEHTLADDAWPIGDATTWSLYPDADGTLQETRPSGQATTSFTSTPLQRQTLEFSTVFADDVVLAGPPRLDLVASVTQQNLDLIVTLNDVDTEGNKRQISQCAINPHLRHGIATPAPVIPGQTYDMRPPCWPLAHVLPAGHELVLEVKTTDADKYGFHENDLDVSVVTGLRGTSVHIPVVEDAVLHEDVLAGVSLPGKSDD